jgi:WD40 repeat protein
MMVVLTLSGKWEAWELGSSGITRIVTLDDAPKGGGWVRFSTAGDLVAIIANENLRTVRFWDLRSGKPVGKPCVYETIIPTSPGMPGAFSPDGRHFAAGTVNGVVKVWDVAAGVAIMQLSPLRDATIRFVDYSPDGTRIVTANYWGETQLWDAATGRPASAILYHSGSISSAVFSRDGKYLLTASGDGTARVWDGHDGAPVGEPMSHRAGMRSAQFSADGSRMVTTSHDATARVWDVQTGQPLTAPMAHPSRVVLAVFSPDGRFVRTETVGSPAVPGAFYLWSVPPPLPAGATAPEWLLHVAAICAAKTINEAGQCVDVPEVVAQIDNVRRQLAALPDNAPFVEWGRWIFNDRADRSIAPGLALTPAEAEKLAVDMAAAPPSAR